jgi:hypothetical protein
MPPRSCASTPTRSSSPRARRPTRAGSCATSRSTPRETWSRASSRRASTSRSTWVEAPSQTVRLRAGFEIDPSRADTFAAGTVWLRNLLGPAHHLVLEGRAAYGYIFDKTADEPPGFYGEGLIRTVHPGVLGRTGDVRTTARYVGSLFPRAFLHRGTTGVGARTTFLRGLFLDVDVLGFFEKTERFGPFLAEEREALALSAEPWAAGAEIDSSFVWDGRDDPVEPMRGGFASIGSRINPVAGDGVLGHPFFNLSGDGRGFVPFTASLSLGLRAYGEWSLVDGAEGIPLGERLFGGGSYGFRGLGAQRLSPVVLRCFEDFCRDIPVGGRSLVETSLEVRFLPPQKPYGAIVFADLAGASGDLNPFALGPSFAAGIGARLRLWYLPAAIDVSYRVLEEGAVRRSRTSRFAYSFGSERRSDVRRSDALCGGQARHEGRTEEAAVAPRARGPGCALHAAHPRPPGRGARRWGLVLSDDRLRQGARPRAGREAPARAHQRESHPRLARLRAARRGAPRRARHRRRGRQRRRHPRTAPRRARLERARRRRGHRPRRRRAERPSRHAGEGRRRLVEPEAPGQATARAGRAQEAFREADRGAEAHAREHRSRRREPGRHPHLALRPRPRRARDGDAVDEGREPRAGAPLARSARHEAREPGGAQARPLQPQDRPERRARRGQGQREARAAHRGRRPRRPRKDRHVLSGRLGRHLVRARRRRPGPVARQAGARRAVPRVGPGARAPRGRVLVRRASRRRRRAQDRRDPAELAPRQARLEERPSTSRLTSRARRTRPRSSSRSSRRGATRSSPRSSTSPTRTTPNTTSSSSSPTSTRRSCCRRA